MKQPSNNNKKEDFDTAIASARKSWLDALTPFKSSPETVELPHPAPMLSDEHLQNCILLADRSSLLTRMPKSAIVAEMGAKTGEFSKVILDICQPAELHLIDHDLQSDFLTDKFKSQVDNGTVQLHKGNTSTVMRDAFSVSAFDFIYINSNHAYHAVKKDIEIAKLKLKPGGYLIFHDYTYWSPVECMTYGVMQAVNELCLDEIWQMRFFTLAHYMYCDVAIQKPAIESKNQIGFGRRLKSIISGKSS